MKLQRLKYGKTRPCGKIKEMMENDLRRGFTGHLDEMAPDIMINDDIFGKNRRVLGKTAMDLGTNYVDPNLAGEYMWWNCESQGNWMDGFVRSAFITDVPEMQAKAKEKLQHYIDTIDEDGYFGIYKPGSRYAEGCESGELWAQSAMLRAITAYYEYTGDKAYLDIIRRSADLTMQGYPMDKSRPFNSSLEPDDMACGGISHGLTVTDTFYFLYKETGEKKYLDYAVWMYKSASAENKFASDIPLRNLLDENYRFKAHGVHTYEHLRSLSMAKYFGNDEIYSKAFDGYMKKAEPCICPSGGPTGDEHINEHHADASNYGYEYCSIHELFHSLSFLTELSGDMKYADKAEWLFYNAALGAHHPNDSSVTYLKTDNCYRLCSTFIPKTGEEEIRSHHGYKYSPVHQDTAVCCVPNAARLYPYFYGYMWSKTETGFLKSYYGASVLEDEINGIHIKVTENSEYPYCGKLNFSIECSESAEFTLSFRVPSWCKSLKVSEDYIRENNIISITKVWKDDSLDIEFAYETQTHRDNLGDIYYTYGPMVMALPIKSREKITKEYPFAGAFDREYTAADDLYLKLKPASEKAPIVENGTVMAEFLNIETGEKSTVPLVPMCDTVLRRITFTL